MLLCLSFPHFLYSVTQWPVPSLDSDVSGIMLSNHSLSSPMLCRVCTHPFKPQIFVSNKITMLHLKNKDSLSSSIKYSTLQVSTTVLQLLSRTHPEKVCLCYLHFSHKTHLLDKMQDGILGSSRWYYFPNLA